MATYWTPFVNPTIATSIYTANDALGLKSSFTNVPPHGVIMSLLVIDRDSEDDALDIVFFRTDIVGTADLDPFAPSDTELSLSMGSISVVAGDYATFANNSLATVNNIGLPYWAPEGVLYWQLVTRATPTYTATTDILVAINIVY